MYLLRKIDMYSLKFVEACSCCLDHRFLRGLRLQAFHSSDIIGLFSVVERSPEITLSKESNFKKGKHNTRHSRRWRKVWQSLPEGSPAHTKKDFPRILTRDSKPKENDQKISIVGETER